ncbi:hypothetical protein R5M74_02705 [Aeromonas hydrophila]|nr:hypothetical protein R5M74_02705 [Aeromonas hydrophila]
MSQQPGTKNPYQEEIDRIGIGAFALLPAKDHSGSCWLQTFLEQKLGKSGAEFRYPAIHSDHFYLEEPSRIATLGMQQVRHHDLTLIIPTAPENSRPASYFDTFRDGSARWYHTPAETIATRYDDQLMNEISYLAVATLAAMAEASRFGWGQQGIRSMRPPLSLKKASCGSSCSQVVV